MTLVSVFMLSVLLTAAAGINLDMFGKTDDVHNHETTAQPSACVGGTTYTRWGRTTCPTSSTLLYKGMAAGAHYTHAGGGASYLCLPKDPEWGSYQDGYSSYSARLYGAEYETWNQVPFAGNGLHNHDVPCAVCHVSGRSAVMIPGRRTCKGDGWVSEYSGYLMAEYHGHARTEWVCMDSEPEKGGSPVNHNGALFYSVEGTCGSLECPPYVEGREITCVVCTK